MDDAFLPISIRIVYSDIKRERKRKKRRRGIGFVSHSVGNEGRLAQRDRNEKENGNEDEDQI